MLVVSYLLLIKMYLRKNKGALLYLKGKEKELVLAARIGKKKGKWNKGKKGIKSVQNPKIKKDKSKLKCFDCCKLGQFVADCWKKGKCKHDASTAKEKHALLEI